MGFFSGLLGQTKGSTTPATGYYALPSDLRSQYTNYYNAIPGATTADAFTRPDFNNFQTQAFDNIQQQANPTSQNISSLVNTYMNPYNDAVLNQINTQANGQYSQLKQAQAANGQIGSNRGVLGANDVDMQRLNQQQGFLQGQFNNALQTGLSQQQLGIGNLLGAGNQIQEQQYQNQLAPYQALQAQSDLLNPAAQFVGGSSQALTTKGSGITLGGLLNSPALKLAALGATAGAAGGFFGAGGSGVYGASGLGGLGQGISSIFSSSPVGPYQPIL